MVVTCNTSAERNIDTALRAAEDGRDIGERRRGDDDGVSGIFLVSPQDARTRPRVAGTLDVDGLEGASQSRRPSRCSRVEAEWPRKDDWTELYSLTMAEADATAAGPLNEPVPTSSPSTSTPTSTQAQQPSPNFVAPSDYLRPRDRAHGSKSRGPMSPLDIEQLEGLVSPP